jgi:RHS repeat-associated protein
VYYHQDGLGSVTQLTDSFGNVVEKYAYDIFGKATITNQSNSPQSISQFGNRYLFTGREWLSEVGLYDYRNRVYSCELGRFLQTDPIKFDGNDVNLYRYVSNAPINLIDPTGTFSFIPAAAFTALIILAVVATLPCIKDTIENFKELTNKLSGPSLPNSGVSGGGGH